MLNVKTPDEVIKIILRAGQGDGSSVFAFEIIGATDAVGRVLHKDIIAEEDIPGFNRSTVDGYAVIASDTFGCSESTPAVLKLAGEVLMGESAKNVLTPGSCIIVSTGGEIPDGADAVVMIEFTEDFESGTSRLKPETDKEPRASDLEHSDRMIGVLKPVAPGNNVIFKNDDVTAGDVVLQAGTKLTAHGIGILSALGCSEVEVRCKPIIGVISTGDELVAVSSLPANGQVRDVNTPMLIAAVTRFGALAKDYGIVKDDEAAICSVVMSAVESCDIVLISGGSSAGARDMTARVIESQGELLLHGIAMKPGKPTIFGIVGRKPIFGLPGHPVAAYMVTELFVRPLIENMMGAKVKRKKTRAILAEALSSNHGRAEYIAVRLEPTDADEKIDNMPRAHPIRGKSGLITSLAGVDGYICIPRDCEGLAKSAEVNVTYF